MWPGLAVQVAGRAEAELAGKLKVGGRRLNGANRAWGRLYVGQHASLRSILGRSQIGEMPGSQP